MGSEMCIRDRFWIRFQKMKLEVTHCGFWGANLANGTNYANFFKKIRAHSQNSCNSREKTTEVAVKHKFLEIVIQNSGFNNERCA